MLVYILFNTRKHDAQRGDVAGSSLESLDRMSSGPWLANGGWRRAGGGIRFDERPRLPM